MKWSEQRGSLRSSSDAWTSRRQSYTWHLRAAQDQTRSSSARATGTWKRITSVFVLQPCKHSTRRLSQSCKLSSITDEFFCTNSCAKCSGALERRPGSRSPCCASSRPQRARTARWGCSGGHHRHHRTPCACVCAGETTRASLKWAPILMSPGSVVAIRPLQVPLRYPRCVCMCVGLEHGRTEPYSIVPHVYVCALRSILEA